MAAPRVFMVRGQTANQAHGFDVVKGTNDSPTNLDEPLREAAILKRQRTLEVMASHISADEAAQTFPDVIERVRRNREVIVIECEYAPVCQISPLPQKPFTLADLARLLKTLPCPRPDDAFFDDVEEATRNQPVALSAHSGLTTRYI